MTTYAASVTIVDLPVGTTVTGAELFEAVQTANGVVQSVQLTLTQMLGIGGLPTGGATGTLLNKASASNYSTQFSAINTFVNIGTALATTGSATSIVVFVATSGIGSTQLGAFAVVGGAISTGAVDSTQIANNAIGTNQLASSLGIATSLSIGGLLTVGGTATITGTAILNGGLQVAGPITATGKQTLLSATGLATVGTAAMLVSSVASFGMFCGTGVPTVSAGTGSIYLRNDGTTATTRMYININGTGTWTGVTTVA